MFRVARPLVVLAMAAAALSGLPVAAATSGSDCPSGTVAMTFDDGSSYFRPETLKILRDKRVPATFFETGMRVAANPQLSRFAVREGHTVLNHTYYHENLGEIPLEDVRYELLATEKVFALHGITKPYKGMREPFGGGDAESRQLITELGFVNIGITAGGLDFVPGTPPEVIRDAILLRLSPGGILLMHDGPVDTTAGDSVIRALPGVIDGVRERGYCFGAVDKQGKVVPGRYTPSRQRIPEVIDPVPYRPIFLQGVAPLGEATPPGPSATMVGTPVRYLSVELDDLGSAVAPRLASRLAVLIGTAETAQLRGIVPAQRDRLATILRVVNGAPSAELRGESRHRLRSLTQRMIGSLDDA